MNAFDYFLDNSKNLDKDFILSSKERVSFRYVYENSLLVASYLNKRIGEGQNIVLIGQNSVFFIIAYLGILKSGNICVPLNPAIEQGNLNYITELTDCKVIFLSKDVRSGLNIPGLLKINEDNLSVILNEKQNFQDFNYFFDDNRLAEIIFTSGSTGIPKGVMLSHKNLCANCSSIVDYLKLSACDRVEVVLPFFYCYGLSLLHTHLRVGGSIVLNNNFVFLGSVINDLNNYKCTGFAGVPSHFQMLLKKSKSFKNTEFPYLRYVTQAGGKLHDVFIQEFVDSFPDIEFFTMYGQTEATARLSYLPPELLHDKLGSIGRGIPGVTLKVINEKHEDIKLGETGELIAHGDNIMQGYFKDEEGTQEVLKNGWLYTGDLARIDEDGYIFLTARKKEIIKVAGKRVSPKEIEEVILSIPEVMDCTIEGVDDDLLGEAIKANLVLSGNYEPELVKEKVLRRCNECLSLYKIPRIFLFNENLNVNAAGKKVKHKL